MLHPLEVVTCEAAMMRLVQFQCGLLKLATEIAAGTPSNETTFKTILQSDAGRWFWSKYEQVTVKKGIRTNSLWKKHLDSLVDAIKEDSTSPFLSAFNHDVLFWNHLTDSTWEFQYPDLSEVIQKAIKPLFVHCYDYLGGTGYAPAVHGTIGSPLTREHFLEHYIGANPSIRVCPVCDAELEYSEIRPGVKIPIVALDHFFPKAHYPFLSLHPYNLIPACTNCNSIFKLEHNPLMNLDTIEVPCDALQHTYHSYLNRAVLKLDRLAVTRKARSGNELQVEIFNSSGTSERRIQTAIHVYNLPDRWRTNIYEKVVEPLIDSLRTQAFENPTRNSLDLSIILRGEKRRCLPGRRMYHVLRSAYLEYALDNLEEQSYLLKAFKDELR